MRRVAPHVRVAAFVGRDASEALFEQPWSDGVEWVRLPVRTSQRTHLLGQLVAMPAIAIRKSLDVLHSPANVGPPLAPGIARVVTLLDVIWLHQREGWDATRAGRAMAALSRSSATHADRVIAISDAARDDIVASLELDASRVDVTPLGVLPPSGALSRNPAGLRSRFGLDGRQVVLCVAQKRPYKNLGSLVRAIAELPQAVLVLAGAPTPHEAELEALASELGASERVRFLGWVPEDELESLYRLASCFCLPSLIEGFGLPVLEAMARNVPVACSDRTAMAEVAGDAALLFDPEDQEAVTTAVRRLLDDRELAARLVERGHARVALYTWERTAEATLESYRRAVAQKTTKRSV